MRISCLMPTYNRPTNHPHLLAHAVASFLSQDWPDKELIIGNDCPEQELLCDCPGVVVLNYHQRFQSLGRKIEDMAKRATGELLCRWDDDDWSMPWRLSYSAAKIGDRLEWRPANYWWYQAGRPDRVTEVLHAGNTHVMAIWRPAVLNWLGGYPDRTGDEDQAFNLGLAEAGISPMRNQRIPLDEIFYVYRWGVSATHLSGGGGRVEQLRASYERIGSAQKKAGRHVIVPTRWEVPRNRHQSQHA